MSFDRSEYVRIAYYYYRQGLTQEEISRKLNMSRIRVNRILNRCRELGIVRVNILGITDEHFELESQLEEKYALQEVRIAEAFTVEDVYDAVGLLAAEYLKKEVGDRDIIGFSRGRTLSRVMDLLPRLDKKGVISTQLLGGWNHSYSFAAANDIAHRFAERAHANLNLMHAPVLVHNKKFKDALWEEPSFLSAYDIIKRCRIAMVGIGAYGEDPLFLGNDQAAREEYLLLRQENAIGEVCTHHFDREGRPVIGSFHDKVISILLEDYLRIPIRIGVGFGPNKQNAIAGAIRGGYINALITDVDTGKYLLNEAD